MLRTRNGYAGGKNENPHYLSNLVQSDHIETVDVEFDPKVISYQELLDIFWKTHDPCLKSKTRYMSAIFCHDDEQTEIALKSWDEVSTKQKKFPLTTAVLPARKFHVAEEYVPISFLFNIF